MNVKIQEAEWRHSERLTFLLKRGFRFIWRLEQSRFSNFSQASFSFFEETNEVYNLLIEQDQI